MDIKSIDQWDAAKPLPTLYAKTSGGAVNVWNIKVEGSEVCVEWGQLDGAQQTARYACEPKNVGRANASTAEQQALLEAISKWKKQIKKKYHTSIEGTETFNRKPMLAKSFKERTGKVQYPASLQPKLDGLRCFAFLDGDEVSLQARGGDPYSVQHIQTALRPVLDTLPPGTILDGELYRHGTSLQTLNSWVRKPKPESIGVEYHVYDVIVGDAPNAPWKDRLKTLEGLSVNAPIKIVVTTTVQDEVDVKSQHDALVQQGYEGAIVRLLGGVYRFAARSSELLKYKDFQDAEFKIVSFTTGKGKFENVPVFKCITAEGKEFDVAPRGSEAERAEMLREAPTMIGKSLTVRYFDLTDEGIPHFPVGVGIREEGA